MQKPLLEHLIELRVRLIYALLALGAGVAVCYPLAPHLFQFLTEPLWHAMGEEGGRRLIYTGLTEAFLTYLKLAFFWRIYSHLSFYCVAIMAFCGARTL
jgi:sec-independent protein translocase protein TatC